MRFSGVILLLFLVVLCQAQKDGSFVLLTSFKGEVADAAIDNLGNTYLLTKTGQLKKFNSSGDSMAVYNQVRRFGKLHSIDVSNPLKVLLYYKDFSSVVILDRLLAIRSTIDLRQQNILQASAIGLSYDNNIWLFDVFNNKLKKIDEQGNTLLETPDLRNVFAAAIQPIQIIDHNNQVYLYDTLQGVFVFDYYGAFKRKIHFTGWSNISVTDKYLLGVNQHSVEAYNTATLMPSQQKLPASFAPYHHYRISGNKLMALSKDGLFVYRIGN